MSDVSPLQAEIRRRPFGHTIIAICLDLAALPGLCTSAFSSLLLDITLAYGGREDKLMEAKQARHAAFERWQDLVVGSNGDWVNATRQAVRDALGCLIGEELAEAGGGSPAPCQQAAAVATRPP